MKLFCSVVGERGSAFPVDIDESHSAGALKNMIRANPEFIYTQTKLNLYLAKKNDEWLDINGANAVTLDEDKNPQFDDEDGNVLGFKMMNPSLSIGNDSHFGKGFKPKEGDIHVLVLMVVPDAKRQRTENDSSYDPLQKSLDLMFRLYIKDQYPKNTAAYR